jgi:hypothetical protein
MQDALIRTNEAIGLAESRGHPVTRATILSWAKRYGLGRKITGKGKTSPVYFHKQKFLIALKGLRENDPEALKLLERWEEERKGL